MTGKLILASFASEEDLLGAVADVRKSNWTIVDVYAPYAVHGLERLLGWRRSRLPAACLLGGAAGIALALWFQFWTTTQSWPLDVGGRPWNSLPAFVPVTFECMVLFGGFALVLAWLVRSGLYPGKNGTLPLPRVTDDHFGLAIHQPDRATDPDSMKQLLLARHAVELQVHAEEEQR